MSTGRVAGRVALVTGGAQGLGASYARALLDEGARVAVADIKPEARAAAQLPGVIHVLMDVADAASVGAGIARVVREWGRLDILISNAAIFTELSLRPFTEVPLDEWDRVMAVNVRGPFLCARAAAPIMQSQGYGRIINIASGTVFKGTPGMLHYVTSKGAVVAMTRCLARELGPHGICVNTLAPGFVLTDGVLDNQEMQDRLTPSIVASRAIARDGRPEDLTGALLFLASEEARFTTGQVLVVDGGSVTH